MVQPVRDSLRLRDAGTVRPACDDNRGITLMGVLVMVIISSVMLAAAMPLWTTVVQREKEADLIYRGEQYATAIERFQAEVQRPPTKLEELLSYKTVDQKRFIRKLYKDPMSKDGEWEIIYADAASLTGVNPAANRPWSRGTLGRGEPSGSQQDREEEEESSQSGPSLSDVSYSLPGRASRQQLKGGYILGVKSKSQDPSIKIYQGKEQYNEWEFKARMMRRNPPRQSRRSFDKSMYQRDEGRKTQRGSGSPRNLRYKGGFERRIRGNRR